MNYEDWKYMGASDDLALALAEDDAFQARVMAEVADRAIKRLVEDIERDVLGNDPQLKVTYE